VRRRLVVPLVLVLVAVIAVVVVSGSSGDSSPAAGDNAKAAAKTQTPRASANAPLPTRRHRAQVVEPVAGETAASAALPVEEDPAPAGKPTGAASATSAPRLKRDNGPTSDAAVSEADVLKNGIALPPIEAPTAVRQIIEAGNYIARTPYLWGGGHGKWLDNGYDCSGSISYALARAGLLNAPQDSGRLMGWGEPGRGKWVTIYANPGHVYMVVAGVRFDTSGRRSNGSRWQKEMRPGGGFVARHPTGL
jgi:cell wall-associated NlpC family hydrolase